MRSTSIGARIAPAPPVFPPVAGHLGILMLDTRFPRPPGDVGHPATWKAGTEYFVVENVGPQDAVRAASGFDVEHVLPPFAAGARELQRRGATAITTSCGFLVLLQEALQAAVEVPLVTSSLLLLPEVLGREGSVAVLTISAERLGTQHLLAAGVSRERLADVVLGGVSPGSEFARAILGNRDSMDLDAAQREVVAAAVELARRAPQAATMVLECTNLPPYAQAIREATGLKVLSLADVPALQPYAAHANVATP